MVKEHVRMLMGQATLAYDAAIVKMPKLQAVQVQPLPASTYMPCASISYGERSKHATHVMFCSVDGITDGRHHRSTGMLMTAKT